MKDPKNRYSMNSKSYVALPVRFDRNGDFLCNILTRLIPPFQY
jgi:hypothetical protein